MFYYFSKKFLRMRLLLSISLALLASFSINAQTISDIEDQTGAWYMYFYNTKIGEGPWGVQGDFQHRNFDLGGDLEQLLLRSGVTYNPEGTDVLLTLGYGNITSGVFGTPEEGEEHTNTNESRIYQEALFPKKLGKRVLTNHRFRYEQRWIENQEMKTRYRYNLFINVPLNKSEIQEGTIYVALYNEIFIATESPECTEEKNLEVDRNRTYGAIGYVINSGIKCQLGYMVQSSGDLDNGQVQLSLHHSF
jgi:hypothetical protein